MYVCISIKPEVVNSTCQRDKFNVNGAGHGDLETEPGKHIPVTILSDMSLSLSQYFTVTVVN